MNNAAQELRERLNAITDMHIAIGLLHWDQQTYMPKGGITMRAETIATLSNIAHRMSTDTDLLRLIDAVGERFDAETDDGALARLARRNFERATRLPAELVTDLARTTALAEPAWVEARSRGEWNTFAPHLFRIVELQKQVADSYGYTTHPYDALLDEYEPGATKAQLETMFDELKHAIVPLVRDIAAKSGSAIERARPLYNSFDEAKQEGVRARCHHALRLRLELRAARPHRASFLHQLHLARCAYHHALRERFPSTRTLRNDA
jgi:carboxypeptidase Taq